MIRLLRFIAGVVLACALPLSVAQAEFGDEINSYDVDLQVQTDGTLQVREIIRYDFAELEPAHGIERYIPISYSSGLLGDHIDVELQSVTDEAGNEWPVDTRHNNGYLIWRIGDPDTTVTGEHTYVLNYTANWVLTDYHNYVELYWDVIGTEWTVPIQVAHIRVTVPPDSQVADYPARCYFGGQGEDRRCTFEQAGNSYTTTVHSLDANQGVTVLFAFAPSTIQLPSGFAVFWHWFKNNWSLFFIPGWLIVAIVLAIRGRATRPSKPLIPIYEIPAGVTSPAMAEYLLNGKITAKTFAAELIESARLGELELIYDPDKGQVKSLRATGAIVRKDGASTLLHNLLFSRGNEIELKRTTISSNAFLNSAKLQSDQAIKQQGWIDAFKKRMKLAMTLYALAGFILGGLMLSIGNNQAANHLMITGGVFMIVGVVVFLIQATRLPLNTAGADARRLAEGFKWFLGVTETERLKFNQVPKLTPKMFEDYLPYAIVFGVEKQWVKQFEYILTEPPTWMHGVNQALLYNALLSTGRVPQQFRVPASARAGGSGFSGGGFSGGGFGGGGGGRW